MPCFLYWRKNKIGVRPLRAEKAIGRVGYRRTDENAVFHRVLRLTPVLLPSLERFTIEQALPLGLVGLGARHERKDDQRGNHREDAGHQSGAHIDLGKSVAPVEYA